MRMTMHTTRTAFLATFLAGALLSLPSVSLAAAVKSGSTATAQATALDESSVAGAVAARLNKKQFRDVKVSVENGIATLTGTVDLYEYKSEADKRVHKVKGVSAVRNDIEVAGPAVPDQQLQDKLVEKLTYDRVGYGNVFNAISVKVQNGEVTLGGHARTPVDKDSALALVSTYPGVKDVIDEVEVDPPSPMDDGLRIAVARAIYGFPSLNRYAIDPAKTIRITVDNGHVQLDGVVDSKADRDVAGLRANGVPGVFSVKNNLQVTGQPAEAMK